MLERVELAADMPNLERAYFNHNRLTQLNLEALDLKLLKHLNISTNMLEMILLKENFAFSRLESIDSSKQTIMQDIIRSSVLFLPMCSLLGARSFRCWTMFKLESVTPTLLLCGLSGQVTPTNEASSTKILLVSISAPSTLCLSKKLYKYRGKIMTSLQSNATSLLEYWNIFGIPKPFRRSTAIRFDPCCTSLNWRNDPTIILPCTHLCGFGNLNLRERHILIVC